MKCGLIWARRARTSASISSVRDASSSASSTWTATQSATSLVARTRPAPADGANAATTPTTREPARTGAMTAARLPEARSAPRSRAWSTAVRPADQDVRSQVHQPRFQFLGGTVPGEHARGIGDRQRVTAQQGAQLAAGLRGARRVEPGAQVLPGTGRGVQGVVRGALGIGAQVAEGAQHLDAHTDDDGDRQHDHGDGRGGQERGVRHGAQRSGGCRLPQHRDR